MRLLDLFSGAGGAAVGYHRAGYEVVGVDICPQPNYPFEHHVGDALQFLADHGGEFDVIHASPPCQVHSTLVKASPYYDPSNYLDFIPQTQIALELLNKPYVIENLPTSTLRRDVRLCGLMFGLHVFRHRIFQCGGWLPIEPPHIAHKGHRVAGRRHGRWHEGDMVSVYGNGSGDNSIGNWQHAMGISWTNERREIAEAIPPAYTQYLGEQMMHQ